MTTRDDEPRDPGGPPTFGDGDHYVNGVAPEHATSPRRARRKDDAKTDDDDGEPKTKQAEVLIQIVREKAYLFHDPKGVPYAAIKIRERRAVFKLRSTPMRSWIARTVREALGHCVGSTMIDEALVALDGIARFDCDEHPVYLRVAEHDGALYIDLGDETGECVEVTSKDWSVRAEAPVMFRRPDAMRPLPRPVPGGKVDDLRAFVNLPDDDSYYLLVAWIVAALRPGRPFTILALHGEQGTAKTTASRVVRALVDPNVAPVRSVPRSEDDLAVASVHSHVVAFDNLSGVAPWLSDALCRLATGGGLSKRTLYTEDDETIIDAIRPVIVNGIDDIANRADLAERCLVLTLQPIPKGKRRDEASFWRAFGDAAPRIFGWLLDGVVSALRNVPNVQLADLPRMADFTRWIVAAEPGLGLKPGTLLAAYERNRARVVDVALETSPVATAVRRLLDLPQHAGRWEGEPEQAHTALSGLVSEETKRDQGWPKSASVLSKKLRRSATFLRSVGIELDLDGHEGRDDEKRRVWRFARVVVPSDPASPAAGKQPESGDVVGTTPPSTPTPPEHGEIEPGGRGDDGNDSSRASLRGGCFADLLDDEGES